MTVSFSRVAVGRFSYFDRTEQLRALLLNILGEICCKLRSKTLTIPEVMGMNKANPELFYDSV
jgi:hypothetical protein